MVVTAVAKTRYTERTWQRKSRGARLDSILDPTNGRKRNLGSFGAHRCIEEQGEQEALDDDEEDHGSELHEIHDVGKKQREAGPDGRDGPGPFERVCDNQQQEIRSKSTTGGTNGGSLRYTRGRGQGLH